MVKRRMKSRNDVIAQLDRILDYYGDDGNPRSEKAKAIEDVYEENIVGNKRYREARGNITNYDMADKKRRYAIADNMRFSTRVYAQGLSAG